MLSFFLAVFVVSATFGMVSVYVAMLLNGSGVFVPAMMLAGLANGAAWVLAVQFVPFNFFAYSVAGCAMPIICCVTTVVGIGFLPMVIYWWYVFFPLSVANGVVLYLCTPSEKAMRKKVRSRGNIIRLG